MQSTAENFADEWGLSLLSQVADTGHAQVWKVQTASGPAALKLYHRMHRGNEAAGADLMRLWQDRGAVRILAEAENAVLMEWLEGQSLGDMARAEQPDSALQMLAETARRLHRTPVVQCAGLKPLHKVFAPLFDCTFADSCPATFERDMRRSIDLAQDLLDAQTTVSPLHGDLHPDNVILTPDGPRLIDAKGYLGDPTFELANALRHPKGMPDLVCQMPQIETCLTLYADAMGVSRARLAKWAAAKCALSIFWRSNGPIAHDDEAELLNLFLKIAGQ